MKFTYDSYKELIGLLRQGGYSFADYHTYKDAEHPVILRHDRRIYIKVLLQESLYQIPDSAL